MKRIISCALAASAIFAFALTSADAASRKHHPTGHYSAVATKLRPVASLYLAVGKPPQTGVGRSMGGDVIDRDGWRLNNGNWDSSCFRTLNYLSSATACSGSGM